MIASCAVCTRARVSDTCHWCDITRGLPAAVLCNHGAVALLRGRVRVRELGVEAARNALRTALQTWSGSLAFIEWHNKRASRTGTDENPNTLGVVHTLTMPALKERFRAYANRVVPKGTGRCVAYSVSSYGGSSDAEAKARTALFMDCDGRGEGATLMRLLEEFGAAHLIARRKQNHHLIIPLAEHVLVNEESKHMHRDEWAFVLGVFSELAEFAIDGGTEKKPTPTALGYDISSAQRYSQLEYLYTRREQSDAAPSITAHEGLALNIQLFLANCGYAPPAAPPRKIRPRTSAVRAWTSSEEAPPADAAPWIRALFDAGMLGKRLNGKGFVCVCPLASEHTERDHSETSTIVHDDGRLLCLRSGGHLHGRMDEARNAMPASVQHHFDTAGQARLRAMLEEEQPPAHPREDAAALLESAIRNGASTKGEVLVVQAPTGIGKSHATRAAAAASHEAWLLSGPSHRLLEQNRDAFKEQHNQPASLRRGVLRVVNADGSPACKLFDIAVQVQEAGASVPDVLCKGCKHEQGCPATQTEAPERVEFLPHAMLHQRLKKKEYGARIVADETPALLEPVHLGPVDFQRLHRAAHAKAPAERAPFVGGWRVVVRPWLAIMRAVMEHGGLAEATRAALDNETGDELIAAAVHRATTIRVEKRRVHDQSKADRFEQLCQAIPPTLGDTFAKACAAMVMCGRPRLHSEKRLEDCEENERARLIALLASANALYATAEAWQAVRGDARGVRCYALTTEARTLREFGGVVLDATPTIPLLEAVFPRVRVVRIGAMDGADCTREVHYREGATRSQWCPRGSMVRWDRVEAVLLQALERLRKSTAKRVLVVTYATIETALQNNAPASVKRTIDEFRQEGYVLEFAHYGPGIRGLDAWAAFDAFVTLGDPWADVEAVHELCAAANADHERVALAMARADLAQAHGRARDPQRTSAALHLHFGAIAPEGWSASNTVIVCVGRGRKAVQAMSAADFAAAVSARGGVRAAAAWLGVEPSTVSRWAKGTRSVPESIVERMRGAVLPQFPVREFFSTGQSGNSPPAAPAAHPTRTPATPARYEYRCTASGEWETRAIVATRAPWERTDGEQPWVSVPADVIPPDVLERWGLPSSSSPSNAGVTTGTG